MSAPTGAPAGFKGTPGPWRIVPGVGSGYRVETLEGVIVAKVAKLHDAFVIAASLDMLTSLQMAAAAFTDPDSPPFPLREVDIAIAKALGLEDSAEAIGDNPGSQGRSHGPAQ